MAEDDAARLAEENAALRAEIARLRSSLRYRGADILADARSARGAAAAPGRLYGLAREARQSWAWRSVVLSLECGLPDDPLRALPAPPPDECRALLRMARGGRMRREAGTKSGAAAAERAAELRSTLSAGFGLPPSRPLSGAVRTVAYVAHAGLPNTSNGYAVRTHALVRALNEAGLRTSVWLRGGRAGEADVVDGVAYRRLGLPDRQGTYRAVVQDYADALTAQLRDQRPDLIHAASNHVTGHASAHAAAALDVPLAYEVRGLWEVTRLSTEPSYEQALGYRFQRGAELAAAKAAALVLANGEPIADLLARGGVWRGKLRLLPNGCDAGRTILPAPGDRERARQRLGLADLPVIGFVGSVTAYEGLNEVVAASARVGGCQLLVVGDGPDLPGLRAMSEQAGVRAIFTGRLSPGEAAAAYEAIDVAPIVRPRSPVAALVPPLKPIEAMAAGVAVILSDLPPLRALAGEGRAKLVPPGDPDALAAALKVLVHDPDARRRQAERALAWVRAERSWNRIAHRLVEAYAGAR